MQTTKDKNKSQQEHRFMSLIPALRQQRKRQGSLFHLAAWSTYETVSHPYPYPPKNSKWIGNISKITN